MRSRLIRRLQRLSPRLRRELLDAATSLEEDPVRAGVSIRRALEAVLWDIVELENLSDMAEGLGFRIWKILASPELKAVVPVRQLDDLVTARQTLNRCLHDVGNPREGRADDVREAMVRALHLSEWLAERRQSGRPPGDDRLVVEPPPKNPWDATLLGPRGVDSGLIVRAHRGPNPIVIVATDHARVGVIRVGSEQVLAGTGTGPMASRLTTELRARGVIGCARVGDRAAIEEQVAACEATLRVDLCRHEGPNWTEIIIRHPVEGAAEALADAILRHRDAVARALERADNLDVRVWHELAACTPRPRRAETAGGFEIAVPEPLRVGKVHPDSLPRVGQRFAQVLARALEECQPDHFVVSLGAPLVDGPTARLFRGAAGLRAAVDRAAGCGDDVHDELCRAVSHVYTRPAQGAIGARRAAELMIGHLVDELGTSNLSLDETAGELVRGPILEPIVPKRIRDALKKVLSIGNENVHMERAVDEAGWLESRLARVKAVSSQIESATRVAAWFGARQLDAKLPLPPDTPLEPVTLHKRGFGGWATELKWTLMDDARLLVSRRGTNHRIVVCAPHHSRHGAPRICHPPRVSDRGAGLLAAALAELLGATLIVAVRPPGTDPNKPAAASEPYQTAIRATHPALLLEIHGMADASSPHDVEVGRGHGECRPSALAKALDHARERIIAEVTRQDRVEALARERLRAASFGIDGVEPIRFRGRGNAVLRWCAAQDVPAYQVETKGAYRLTTKPPHDRLPRLGQRLARLIALATLETHPEAFDEIPTLLAGAVPRPV